MSRTSTTTALREISQFGSMVPPNGCGQFLVERCPLGCEATPFFEKLIPCIVWVHLDRGPFDENSDGHACREGWEVERGSQVAFLSAVFGGKDGSVPYRWMVCPCDGRLIE